MELWQERVIQEKKELDEKIDKLTNFLDVDMEEPFKAGELERTRLEIQLNLMNAYSLILGARINSWTTDAKEV
jgi:hypothetical protein